MLVIHDEALVKRLETLAAREQQPIETVLNAVLNQLETNRLSSYDDVSDKEDQERQARIQRLKQRMYAKARDYWSAQGNPERAAMTDAEFEAVGFWGFDTDGVPYLDADVDPDNPPHNPGLNMALSARKDKIGSKKHDIARRSREILNTDFVEHLLRYKKQDADEA